MVESSGAAAESVLTIAVIMVLIVTMTMMKLIVKRRSNLVESLLCQPQPALGTRTAQWKVSLEK